MVGSIYQTVFGGNPVAPAIPTYLPLTFSVNTVLGWPLESNITSPAVADWIDASATAGSLSLQYSDARSVSTGYATIINNIGANTFSVLDAQGNTLAAIASGTAWIFVLADNTTLQGTWRIAQLGAGVSTANAAALAGAGLKAITTTLNERIFINQQAGNYTALTSDRAACLDYTGGSGNSFTIDPVGLGSDWFAYVKNSGSGVLTLTPASGTIDTAANKTLNPNDSAIVISTGINLITVGFGQAVASSFNFVTISLAGATGTVVLTGAQLNRIAYKFTGALAGNTVVQVPASIQQYWVDNETTGAFTLTISDGGGSTVTVSQGTRNILYCDGLNVVNAVSAGAGGITLVADGSAAAPGLAWASETDMGLYKVGVNTLGFSTASTARGSINATGNWVIAAANTGIALALTGTGGATTVNITAVGTGSAVNVAGAAATQLTPLSWQQSGQAAWQLYEPVSSSDFRIFGNGGDRFIITSAGNITAPLPASGTTLVLNGVAGQTALQINAGGNGPNDDLFITGSNSAISGQINNNQASNATCNFSCGNDAGHFVVMEVTSSAFTGSIISGAPAGQVALIGSTGNIPLLIMSNHVVAATVGGSGAWAFPPPSTVTNTVTVTGPASSNALACIGNTGASASFGLSVNAGTNSSDYSWSFQNSAGVTIFQGRGDSVMLGHGATNGLTDMTPDQSSFNAVLNGGTTAPTTPVNWYKIGKQVTLFVGGQSFTSNATTFTLTGLPAEIQPATLGGQASAMLQAFDNGVQIFTANAVINNGSGTITLTKNGNASGWTAAGTKSINAFTMSYLLN